MDTFWALELSKFDPLTPDKICGSVENVKVGFYGIIHADLHILKFYLSMWPKQKHQLGLRPTSALGLIHVTSCSGLDTVVFWVQLCFLISSISTWLTHPATSAYLVDHGSLRSYAAMSVF